MNQTFKVAIIGYGAIGGLHARAIRDLPRLKLVGAFGTNPQLGPDFEKNYGGKYYGDIDRMLEEQKPDLVTVATPSGTHLDTSLKALERGISVLCEKPLEISLERIDRLIDAAARNKATLGGIFPQRFNGVTCAVHEAADQGRFGDLAVVCSYVPWWRDDAYYGPGRWQGTLKFDGGGALMNQSIHGVDLLQWIAAAALKTPADQNPVAEVFAYTAKRAHDPKRLEVEDTCVVVLKFRNGALGQILATTSMYPGSLKRFQIAGRDGTAEILEDQLTTWQFRGASDRDAEILGKFGKATSHGGGASDPMAIDYSNHTRNIAAFIEALERGQKPAIDGLEARKAVAIIEAVYRSAASGSPERVG